MASVVNETALNGSRRDEEKHDFLPVLCQPKGEQSQSKRRSKPSPIETLSSTRARPSPVETTTPLGRMAKTAADMAAKSPLGNLLQAAAMYVQNSPLGRAAASLNSFCNAVKDPSTPFGSVVRSPVAWAARLAERSADVAMRSPVARSALQHLKSFRVSPNPVAFHKEEASCTQKGSVKRSLSLSKLVPPSEATFATKVGRAKKSPSLGTLISTADFSTSKSSRTKRSPSVPKLVAKRQDEAEQKHYARLGMAWPGTHQRKTALCKDLVSSPLTSTGLARQGSEASLATTATPPSVGSSQRSRADPMPPNIGISGRAGMSLYTPPRNNNKSPIFSPTTEKKARKVGLMRIMYKLARRHHEARTTFQARKAGTAPSYPEIIFREVVTDLRLALRVVGHLDRFLLMLTPRQPAVQSLSMSQAQAEESLEASSHSMADDT
eukprot:TRINITY_DN42477_c0_g1_i1.p1 TRINITY_DN42477_c0_g1~~TRINITY_DN42477_c0_g1_i1.p1  ORF type:complete len:437 (+),score=44.47 TRINITY_DN42477_c0_g1_i1:51-1361(+)